jgi:hypothetical protein
LHRSCTRGSPRGKGLRQRKVSEPVRDVRAVNVRNEPRFEPGGCGEKKKSKKKSKKKV